MKILLKQATTTTTKIKQIIKNINEGKMWIKNFVEIKKREGNKFILTTNAQAKILFKDIESCFHFNEGI